MTDISAEVWAQFEMENAELEPVLEAAGSMLPAEVAMPGFGEPDLGAGGCAAATNVMLDHAFTTTLKRVWAHAGGAWRRRQVTATEEAGLIQVAFAADQVVVCWDASNHLTLMRCVKSF